jgi:hypothetical protein
MMDHLERTLLDAERPVPGADVRVRVLASTMPLVRPDSSRLDRLWFSPRWRTAAVLALLALAGVETASRYIVTLEPAGQDVAAANATQSVAMAAREGGLTADETVALCAQASAAARAAVVSSWNMDTSVTGSQR